MKTTVSLTENELRDLVIRTIPGAKSARFSYDPPTGNPTDPGCGVTACVEIDARIELDVYNSARQR